MRFLISHLPTLWFCRCCLLLLALGWGDAAQAKSKNRKLEYILFLSREVTWPDHSLQGGVTFELIGAQEDFIQAVQRAAAGTIVQGKPVRVVVTPTWEAREPGLIPNIAYVAKSETAQIPMVYEHFRGKPVLVVTERPYYGYGWMVCFPHNSTTMAQWSFQCEPTNIRTFANLSVSDLLQGEKSRKPTRMVAEEGGAKQQPTQPPKKPTAGLLSAEAVERQLNDLRKGIASRDQRIAVQEQMIISQKETIYIQGMLIDSLALVNSVAMELLAAPIFDPIEGMLLPSAEVRDRERLMRISNLHRIDSGEIRPQVWTAPWADRSEGGLLFFMLFSFTCIAVLSLALLQPVSVFGREYSDRAAVGGGSAAAVRMDNEEEGEETELDRLMAYNRRLEMQMQIRMQEYQQLQEDTVLRSARRQAFLANMSHEFRTPLNAIVGLSQYLATAAVSDQELREILNIVDQNAYSLMRMMNVLMTLAMLYNGDLEAEQRDTTIHGIFQRLEQTMDARRQELGNLAAIPLHYQMPPVAPTTVRTDAGKLVQLLDLLITNTFVAFPEGRHTCGCTTDPSGARFPEFFVEVEIPSSAATHAAQEEHTAPSRSAATDMANNLSFDLACSLAELLGLAIRTVREEGRVAYVLPLLVEE